MIIGICGGSGSGKTTLLKRLSKEYADLKPTIFSLDNYYLPIENQFVDEKGEINFDLPTALDEEKLTSDIQKLVKGESIEVKEYFFNAPPNKNVLITLDPSPLIIVEGLFLFYFKGVRELLDYTIFIDVDPNVQLDRRLYRDQESRGYSREAILYQWKNHVLPCYEKFVLPYEHQANFRFRNDYRADEDFEKLKVDLNKKLIGVFIDK
ncbi:MAG: uridine kinase [Flavobacteriia bacterium]|nr:uridine kinase [Flavobacteriia bacterium]